MRTRIRAGYYSDAYLNLARQLLREQEHRPQVLTQVFQREEACLGGIDEALAAFGPAARRNDFTADVVMVEGRPTAKIGRRHRPNARLERVH